MKKILAIFLLLTMLVPMCVVVSAEEVADKPFYLLNMTPAISDDVSNVYATPIFYGLPVTKENPVIKTTWGDSGPDRYKVNVENFSVVAAALKAHFEDYPAGTRYVFLEALRVAFRGLAEDVVFMEKGVEATQYWLDRFLKEYKAIGGQLDGLIIDLEYEDAYSWFVFERHYSKDPSVYKRISDNPKYKTMIRPYLADRGFKFYENVSGNKSELYSIYPNAGAEYSASRSIWDAVLRDMMNQYVNQACEPLFKYYPDAVLTDYQSKSTYGWLKDVERDGGLNNGTGNINHTVGNRSSEDAYNVRPRIGFFNSIQKMNDYNNAVFENTPYNCFLTDVNTFKLTHAAAKDGKVSFWITDYRYNRENPNSLSNTPYYTEIILHAAMLDPDPLCGYIIPYEIVGHNGTDDPDYIYAVEIASDILKELNRLMGKADRKPIATPSDWNSKFVVSGMYAGGKNYWRVTPDTTVVSLQNFKVKGTSDPTFSAAGKTITFPGGKIIADGNVREVGTCGYWVETAANVSPVITAVDDYYRQYPAFEENFNKYTSGTQFSSSTALPKGAWETKKDSLSSGKVQNGSLAIKGNFALTNTKVPSLINAVDVYARRQSWEVEVTIPADMASYAEIVLLNCVDSANSTKDLGIKISGGKVYYDRDGRYMAMAGVTVQPGSKYTVQRKMNMTADGAFTCDYYIIDATGKQLGSAKNIPLTTMTAPITSIGMSCKNVMGSPVILDNYKLCITGLNINFELYDAGNGMRVKDVSATRQKDTAYRLSWVNATSEAKYYAVVAASYNGNTLLTEQVVRTFKAAPNSDGVVTGIVKNENAGQTLRIYWKETEPPVNEEEIPDGNTPVIPDGSGAGSSAGNGAGSSTGNGAGSSTGNGTDASTGSGTGSSTGNGAGSSTGSGTGSTIGGGTGSDTGDGTGTTIIGGADSSTGDGTGSATGSGTDSSVGDSNNPAATQGDGTNGNVTNEPDNKPKKRGWIIAVVIPVVLAVAGGVAYMVVSMKKKTPKTAEETPETEGLSEE